MQPMILALALVIGVAPMVWADEHRPQTHKDEVKTEDLPKSVTELLNRIQQLSRKIEPEIAKLGSRLGEELAQTVKKLCDELQCQDHPEQK